MFVPPYICIPVCVCVCVWRCKSNVPVSPQTLARNCPVAPWSEGLTLIKPWTMQASKTLQHKDINTQHKKTRSASRSASHKREQTERKGEKTPSPPMSEKKAWLISQATWKLCLLLLLLDLLKAWIWVKHPPILFLSLPSPFFFTLAAFFFFFYLNKGPPPTSLPFVSHLVFCFC